MPALVVPAPDRLISAIARYWDWRVGEFAVESVEMTLLDLHLEGRKKKIEQLAGRLPEDAWSEVLPVEDSGERRPWQWACLELIADPQKGMSR